MASLNGHALLQWLVERGWETVPLPQGVLGDLKVKRDGKVLTLMEAAREQQKLIGVHDMTYEVWGIEAEGKGPPYCVYSFKDAPEVALGVARTLVDNNATEVSIKLVKDEPKR